MSTISIQLAPAQAERLRHVAREDGLTPEEWATMIVADAVAPYLTYTINAVAPGGASLQFYSTHERVYHVAYGLTDEHNELYKQLIGMMKGDCWGNRRKVVGMLRCAGFEVTEVD